MGHGAVASERVQIVIIPTATGRASWSTPSVLGVPEDADRPRLRGRCPAPAPPGSRAISPACLPRLLDWEVERRVRSRFFQEYFRARNHTEPGRLPGPGPGARWRTSWSTSTT